MGGTFINTRAGQALEKWAYRPQPINPSAIALVEVEEAPKMEWVVGVLGSRAPQLLLPLR